MGDCLMKINNFYFIVKGQRPSLRKLYKEHEKKPKDFLLTYYKMEVDSFFGCCFFNIKHASSPLIQLFLKYEPTGGFHKSCML